MPDENAPSVYALVGVLCETLNREYFPVEPIAETCVRRLKAKAYEVLLKKSKKRVEVNEDVVDPIRELDRRHFELRMAARLNPERIMAGCDEFGECLNFVQEEPFFRTETAKAILTFLMAVSDANQSTRQDAVLDTPLLIPGPFTLHANFTGVAHYPPTPNNTTAFATTFKSFELLKNFQNMPGFAPQFKFVEDLKKSPETDSTTTLLTTALKRPATVSFTNCQETWRCGLNINPSLCRFFNTAQQNSSPIFPQKDIVKRTASRSLKSTVPSSELVDLSNDSRHTFTWNWESLGPFVPLARHFVSESDAILHLHGVRASYMGQKYEPKLVQFNRFLSDLKNLITGIQSESFKYDEILIFHMEPDITVSGISASVMQEFVLQFIECGSCYKRLQLMTAKKNLPFFFDGFIFKATCNAVEEYLIKFRQFVVLFEDDTLLGFYNRVKRMMKQITYLAHLFAIHPTDVDVRPPMGSLFLGYLYKEITNATQKDVIMLLVYILKQCCYAYFKYLQKWIFHGILDDPRNELFINFVDHYRANTKYFFDKAYYVQKDSVPGFLQGLEDKILQCGKYTMLLKAYNPAHPVFSLECPSISVCLSFDDVQSVKECCRDYIEKARNICGDPIFAGDVFAARREARRIFQQMVQEKSRRNFDKWTAESQAQAAALAARKRKRLEELQAHLKEVRERKLADKKTELALDLKVLREAQDIEDQRVSQENVEIQKRIEYYQELNAIIEERKQRSDTLATVTSSQIRIETDPPTPTSQSTISEFESCLGDDDPLEEEIKSLYEDASTSGDFIEKLIETEKKLTEYLEATNNNVAGGEIKRSASDVFNSNEVATSECRENKAKVLGSTIGTDQIQSATTATTAPLTEAQKIKMKVLSSEYGIDLNRNETLGTESTTAVQSTASSVPTDLETNRRKMMHNDHFTKINECTTSVQSTASSVPTDLETNRRKMMQNDPFAKFNEEPDRRKLQLDLNTERSRNRRRVLESEYNIITGATLSVDSTPMSTTSDPPMMDDHEEDIKNANVLKLIVPSRPIETPDMDSQTATTIGETPECGLNTAGISSKKGFNFNNSRQGLERAIPTIIDLESEQLPSNDEVLSIVDSWSNGHFNPEFKWKLAADVLSLKRPKPKNALNWSAGRKASDLNVITLTEFLQRSVVVPLTAHLEVMNGEIMRLYLKDLDILGHIKSLRNYFFLMDGEFGSIVCDGLISKLESGARPSKLLSYRMLHTILENALGSSNSGNDKNAAHVSFEVNNLSENFDLTSSDVLSSLSLSYRVSWPENLILNPETLEKYSTIFKYLIKVRRISWVLEESFQNLKEIVKRNGKEMLLSPQYRSVQQIRHKFFHFIHALNNHITSSALQASWKTLKDELVSAKSIEDIYRKHTTYIKRILFLCMLNKRSSEFNKAIENIFKVTLRFSRNLKSREWKRRAGEEFYTHSRYDKLLADETEFEKFIKYTIYLGNKIVRRGYQEEIGEFINLINFNQYYLVDV